MHGLKKSGSINSDDDPVYDSVCSDEDYASIGDSQSLKDEKFEGKDGLKVGNNNKPVQVYSPPPLPSPSNKGNIFTKKLLPN